MGSPLIPPNDSSMNVGMKPLGSQEKSKPKIFGSPKKIQKFVNDYIGTLSSQSLGHIQGAVKDQRKNIEMPRLKSSSAVKNNIAKLNYKIANFVSAIKNLGKSDKRIYGDIENKISSRLADIKEKEKATFIGIKDKEYHNLTMTLNEFQLLPKLTTLKYLHNELKIAKGKFIPGSTLYEDSDLKMVNANLSSAILDMERDIQKRQIELRKQFLPKFTEILQKIQVDSSDSIEKQEAKKSILQTYSEEIKIMEQFIYEP